MHTIENNPLTANFQIDNQNEEQVITDPIETFAEQLEKIDIATYFCHNCTLEQMQKMKQKFQRDKKKEERKKELLKLQETTMMNDEL
ncbi:hypothetical protein LJB95_02680 [Paludibacteraceae bacterium OttesenSCG-928-F17]|nr:hypothetical protein [Paludibacteraceae bacterium OttesenSCG-928-F17]